MSAALDGYAVVITIPVAWGEMDAFGHVNNTVYLRYFESARIAYLERIRFVGDVGAGPILASTECRFRRPLTYPDTVHVGARVTAIEDDRFTMEYVIHSTAQDTVAATGGGVVVSYDYTALRRTQLPADVAARIRDTEGTAG